MCSPSWLSGIASAYGLRCYRVCTTGAQIWNPGLKLSEGEARSDFGYLSTVSEATGASRNVGQSEFPDTLATHIPLSNVGEEYAGLLLI